MEKTICIKCKYCFKEVESGIFKPLSMDYSCKLHPRKDRISGVDGAELHEFMECYMVNNNGNCRKFERKEK